MAKIFVTLAILFISTFSYATDYLTEGFESGSMPSGWGGEASEGDSVTVSSELARTGTYAARLLFHGTTDEDARAELRFNMGTNLTEFWMVYYLYLPAGYTIRDHTGTDNSKFFVIWGTDYAGQNTFGAEMENDETLWFKASKSGYPAVLACSGSYGNLPGVSGTAYPFTNGQWNKVKIHAKVDSGAGDGVLQLYVNGSLVMNNQNLSFTGSPCTPGYWRQGYLMGASNSGFATDTVVYIDDVILSDTDPDSSGSPSTGAAISGYITGAFQ